MSSSSQFMNTPNSPDAQPGEPKEPEGPSVAKDMMQDSQTAPSDPAKPETKPASTTHQTGSEPVVAAASDQEKQREDAQAATPAPTTDSQAPGSTRIASKDASPKAPPTSDSTAPRPHVVPATSDQTTVTSVTHKRDPTPNPDQSSDPEKREEPAPATPTGGPVEQPSSSATNRQLELQRRRSLAVHTRLAQFFTWILLLGFVILPGTFSRVQQSNNGGLGSTSGGSTSNRWIDQIANLPLLPIGYFCCFINGSAVCWLWYLRSDDPDWLYVNLFSAGLVNAFSGLASAFVNIYAAQGGTYGAASTSTLTIAAVCTASYALLTVVYHRKRVRARYQQARRNSGIV